MFEAATGDLKLCEGQKDCLIDAKELRPWLCAQAVCEGTDKSKVPTACFGGTFKKFSQDDLGQINAAICPVIKSPGPDTRKAFLAHLPHTQEGNVVRFEAFLLAIKGSAESCKEAIRNFVGPYGPNWDYKWYKAISGCRILGHERTRAQEEKDFFIWSGVAQGYNKCSDISNVEMRDACYAPGSKPPI